MIDEERLDSRKKASDFSLLQITETGYRDYLATYSVITGIKRSGREADLVYQSGDEIENEWSSISHIPSYHAQ